MKAFTIAEQLASYFPAEDIGFKPGALTKDKAKALPMTFIDARTVMNRLDEVVGVMGWQCEYVPMSNNTICCRIGIRCPDSLEWVWKSDGAGATGSVSDEASREMAQKGGYSDAFKRAAYRWGIGRYLYDIKLQWVPYDNMKRQFVERPRLPAWAVPANHETFVKALHAVSEAPDRSTVLKYVMACGQKGFTPLQITKVMKAGDERFPRTA